MIDLGKTVFRKGDLLEYNGEKWQPLKRRELLKDLNQEVIDLRYEVAVLSGLIKKVVDKAEAQIAELFTEALNDLTGEVE